MNRHFEDAWYYFRRAADHLAIGLREELEPLVAELRARLGEEEEVEEQTRLDRFRTEIRRVEGTQPVRKARERIGGFREEQAAE